MKSKQGIMAGVAVLAACICMAEAVYAGCTTNPAVSGRVTLCGDNDTLGGVEILYADNASVHSDDNGTYTISSMTEGWHGLEFRKYEYETRIVTGVWRCGTSYVKNVCLYPEDNSIYWVDGRAGSDNNTGETPEYPLETIQEAIDMLPVDEDNATIMVQGYGDNETYDGFIIYKEGITVQAADNETVLIKGRELILEDAGGLPTYIIIGASNVRVKGIEIDGYGGQHQQRGLDVGIAVWGNTVDVTSVDGITGTYTTEETVRDVVIENNVLNNIENGYENPGDPADIRGYGIFINGWEDEYGTDYLLGGNVQDVTIRYNRINTEL